MTIAAYPKYESYKDSGVEWMPKLPSHWGAHRSKFVFKQSKELARNGDIQLSATQSHGVIPQADYEAIIGRKVTQIQTNLEKRKHVEINDFVISMRSFQGGLERAKAVGCIRSSYVILKPGPLVYPDFYAYLLKMPQYVKALQLTGNFIRDGQDLNFENFSDVDLFVPPLSEQCDIATFLDGKCATIDEAVRIKEEQIALLSERRQILIQQAVTRGLNPDAPMKDSGIDWIGGIPAHWEVKQFKHLLSEPLKYGANEEAKECVEGDPRYIRITDFGSDGRLKDGTKRTLPQKTARDYLLKQGDILLARSGGTVGKSFLFEEEIEACFAGYLIMARCNREEILSRYMNLFLRSSSFEHWKELIFSRATIQNIGADKYGALVLPVPPISEQRSILNNVETLSAKINRAISVKQDQIATLKEYKTSLINAAVTGKIKVI